MQRPIGKAVFARISAYIVLAVVVAGTTTVGAQNAVQATDPSAIPFDGNFAGEETGMMFDAAVAEPPTLTLTLTALESLALASNPSIARAASHVSAARARAVQVGIRPNPEVGIDFQQLGSNGLAEQYGVAVSQEIVRRQKLELDRSIVLHEASRLEQELAAQRQRVLTDVRIAYVRALRAEKQIELTNQLVELGEQGVRIANELFIAQEVGRTDVLQAELEVESASVLLRNAENRRIAVWQELSAVTASPLEPQPISGDIADDVHQLLFEEALLRLRNQSPEVAAVLAEIQRARCNLNRQQIETQPNVTVQGLINWRDNGIGGDADGGIAVSVPLPLWNKNQGGIRAARHQLGAAERELGQVELSLKQRLAPVYERYRNAEEQVARYRNRILPKSAETLELTREIYELGEINFVNLLTVQRTYANNQLAYLDALETLRIAEAEITGLLLSDSLRSR